MNFFYKHLSYESEKFSLDFHFFFENSDLPNYEYFSLKEPILKEKLFLNLYNTLPIHVSRGFARALYCNIKQHSVNLINLPFCLYLALRMTHIIFKNSLIRFYVFFFLMFDTMD